MVNLIEQFLIIFIIVYSLNKMFLYFKSKNKKLQKILPTEMLLLTKLYGLDLNYIGIKKVENDISIINSIIITIDLLLYYNIDNLLYSIILIFVITFVLIPILYNILAKMYLKKYVR